MKNSRHDIKLRPAQMNGKHGRMKSCQQCGTPYYCVPSKDTGAKNEKKFCSLTCNRAYVTFSPSNAERMFWPKVDRSGGPEACWPYYKTDPIGYGRLLRSGPYAFAHRVAWLVAKGEIPAGLDVLHRCDNRRCCNSAHLFLGTHSDNMQDMIRKGRNPLLRLKPEQVREIRVALKTPHWGLQKELAKKYDVSSNVICEINLGITYNHVD